MSKQFLAVASFFFLALLYIGAFNQDASHKSVFVHTVYAQAEGTGGDMGGAACDAGGGGMGGAACDTGGGSNSGGGNDGDTPYTPETPYNPDTPVIVYTPTGSLSLTKNPCVIAAGQTTCQPYFDWTTANTDPGDAGTVAFNIINTDGNGTYTSETGYAYSHKTTGADGRGTALAAGTYTIKLYGFKSNTWVLLDSKTQTVASNETTPATPTGSLTLTANPCAIAAGATTCQPYFNWTTTNTELGSAGRVAFNIRSVSWTGTYANETSYADSNAASGTGGAGVPLPEGAYTIKLYGFKSNDWVLLDSKTQTVTSNPSTPTGSLTLTHNPCTIAAGATTCQPTFDWTTANTYQSSDGRVAFNIQNNAGTGAYATEKRYAGSNAASGTAGAGAALPAGTYTLKLYGFSLSANTWVLLDTETQVVASNSPDLTVSGITPTSAAAGTPTTFSATVYNTGGGATPTGFKNFYQVKSGTTAYTPQNFFTKLFNIAHAAETITDLSYTTMPALAAGGSGTATQSYTFPAAGTYGIRVCADKADRNGTNGNPNGEIAEADENNNCGGWTNVNVTSLCTPGCSSGSVCTSGGTCVSPGTACSPTNACGQSNSGTYNSVGVCSVSAPSMPPTYGNACTSSANVCGQTNSGTLLCNGTCSATTPSDTLCLPTVTLSADPTRVRRNTSTKLTWTSSAATSCSLTGQNGFSSTALSGTNVDSTPLDAQTTFTLVCSNTYGSKSTSVIVNLVPSYIEL